MSTAEIYALAEQRARRQRIDDGVAAGPVAELPADLPDVPHAASVPMPPMPEDIEQHRLTEIGNGRRLARMFGHELRYVHPWKRWLSWDGKRWCRDELGAEMTAAKAVVASLYHDAATLAARAAAGNERAGELAETLVGFARQSSKATACRAMLALAQSEDPIVAAPDIFDRDPFLLNLLNGTLDLRSAQLRPHQQSDMLTKIAPVIYDEGALCPQWDRFLARVLPDEEKLRFVQRFIGYCLTGNVSEQVLAFLLGLGANGKSVLLDVMLALLGDYGGRSPPDLVLAKKSEAHPTELADLEGKRLVVCSEIEQGRAWAESLIKRITGDTTIKARHMKQDFYEFIATHKLVIAANTRPTVRGTDEGIWRRMKLIGFDVIIPAAERDRGLVARLLATESAGILAWAVAGCLEWQRDGLGSAASIDKATADYRTDQDVLGEWIEECCIKHAGVVVPMVQLHASFHAWCVQSDREPWKSSTLRDRLIERGFPAARTKKARGLQGLALLTQQAEPESEDRRFE